MTVIVLTILYSAKKTQNQNKYYICCVIQCMRMILRPWDFEETMEIEGSHFNVIVVDHCVLMVIHITILIFNFKQTNSSRIMVVFLIFNSIMAGLIGSYGKSQFYEILGTHIVTVIFQASFFCYFGHLVSITNR